MLNFVIIIHYALFSSHKHSCTLLAYFLSVCMLRSVYVTFAMYLCMFHITVHKENVCYQLYVFYFTLLTVYVRALKKYLPKCFSTPEY